MSLSLTFPYLCGRTQAERGHPLGNNLQNHFLYRELLRPNVAEHLAWLRLRLTRHAQQLGVVANVMLPRGDVFVDECRIARAQHNQIEVRVGDQLALVNNPHSKAYRFGKYGNDIYAQVDFICKWKTNLYTF